MCIAWIPSFVGNYYRHSSPIWIITDVSIDGYIRGNVHEILLSLEIGQGYLISHIISLMFRIWHRSRFSLINRWPILRRSESRKLQTNNNLTNFRSRSRCSRVFHVLRTCGVPMKSNCGKSKQCHWQRICGCFYAIRGPSPSLPEAALSFSLSFLLPISISGKHFQWIFVQMIITSQTVRKYTNYLLLFIKWQSVGHQDEFVCFRLSIENTVDLENWRETGLG